MLVVLAACDAGITDLPPDLSPALSRAGSPELVAPPITPVLEVTAPAYPAIAMYIVYREYLHQNPGLTTLHVDDPKYQRYMEKRLRELYPNRGYAGMMRDAVTEARRNRERWEQYERDLGRYRQAGGGSMLSASTQCSTTGADPLAGADPSWQGQDEFPIPPDEQLPTIQMEVDSLLMTPVEIDNIYYFESLATGTYAGGGGGGGGGSEPIYMHGLPSEPTRDDLIRAAAAGFTPASGEVGAQVAPAVIATVALGLTVGWKYFRIQQAADRAVAKSAQYFASQHPADTQRDAFRHVYLSMMLRRHVGKTLSKIVTDRHENESTGPAKVMDLHNNDIGRTHRYSSFRGHWLWDRWDWHEWALKVRNYIVDEAANGEFIPEWAERPTMSTEEAWARVACVPEARYVFFSRATI